MANLHASRLVDSNSTERLAPARTAEVQSRSWAGPLGRLRRWATSDIPGDLGLKTGCGAHSLSTRRTHALSINCGVDHLSQCVCELQYLCTCTEKIRNHKPERECLRCVCPQWFETGIPEAAPLSACPSIPTAQSRWSCRRGKQLASASCGKGQ